MKYILIRQKFLKFFEKNKHAMLDSASLIPENDPSVLFVPAGMFPLVPFLLGEKHPNGSRLANSQRCIRTIDIDEVGDETHCTSFEMLGNWSLNDYFKKEAIELTTEFFCVELGIDINRIYASVFGGDEKTPKDEESINIWKNIFQKHHIKAKFGEGERIQPFQKKENWWELDTGPCGPDSEIFYDTGKEKCSKKCNLSCNCGKYVELGNNVFMEYIKEKGTYKPLGRHNVDFGGGLDRLAMILQKQSSVFETDIYLPILEEIRKISQKRDTKSERIILDHIKAATWIITDGIIPGKTGREYILRRLIRRAIRHGKHLNIKKTFTKDIAKKCIEQFSPIWPTLDKKKIETLNILNNEEERFNKTLESGIKFVKNIIDTKEKSFNNTHGVSFKLYETYGFPPEMLLEELKAHKIVVNEELFWKQHNTAYIRHQEKSRSASKGMFKGGLADTSKETTKLHTATHMLLKALYETLGEHIYQKGSNITPERLRLDFPNKEKLSKTEVEKVERIINKQIEKALPIYFIEKDKKEALKLVPYASFEEKYADKVKIYYIGKKKPFSTEICNGPHVENTSELGKFKIIKQENVGENTKRIKAILE